MYREKVREVTEREGLSLSEAASLWYWGLRNSASVVFEQLGSSNWARKNGPTQVRKLLLLLMNVYTPNELYFAPHRSQSRPSEYTVKYVHEE